MEPSKRKRPPSFASIYAFRPSSTLPFCRITGKSHSMDEHHYVPSSDDFPKFENVSGCRITEKHQHFKDYKYVYPIIDLDGKTRMVTEHDFHCRITAKYKAMAGHKYLYPVLGATTDKTVNDMVSITEEEAMADVIIPSEVELIVRGGIEDVLRLKGSEYLFIYSKEGSVFPAALREIKTKKKSIGSKYERRHTLPVSLEAGMVRDLAVACTPSCVKTVKEIKKSAPEIKDTEMNIALFDKIQENVEVLQDIRKSRPKRPAKHKENELSNNKKRLKYRDPGIKDQNIIHESEKENMEIAVEVIEVSKPQLSRLEKYKQQFNQFSAYENKESGNRLTLVGAFDENEVMELDFSDSKEKAENTYVSPNDDTLITMNSGMPEAAFPASSLLNNFKNEKNYESVATANSEFAKPPLESTYDDNIKDDKSKIESPMTSSNISEFKNEETSVNISTFQIITNDSTDTLLQKKIFESNFSTTNPSSGRERTSEICHTAFRSVNADNLKLARETEVSLSHIVETENEMVTNGTSQEVMKSINNTLVPVNNNSNSSMNTISDSILTQKIENKSLQAFQNFSVVTGDKTNDYCMLNINDQKEHERIINVQTSQCEITKKAEGLIETNNINQSYLESKPLTNENSFLTNIPDSGKQFAEVKSISDGQNTAQNLNNDRLNISTISKEMFYETAEVSEGVNEIIVDSIKNSSNLNITEDLKAIRNSSRISLSEDVNNEAKRLSKGETAAFQITGENDRNETSPSLTTNGGTEDVKHIDYKCNNSKNDNNMTNSINYDSKLNNLEEESSLNKEGYIEWNNTSELITENQENIPVLNKSKKEDQIMNIYTEINSVAKDTANVTVLRDITNKDEKKNLTGGILNYKINNSDYNICEASESLNCTVSQHHLGQKGFSINEAINGKISDLDVISSTQPIKETDCINDAVFSCDRYEGSSVKNIKLISNEVVKEISTENVSGSAVPVSRDSHISFNSTNMILFEDTPMLTESSALLSLKKRLPVTCSLLEKENSFISLRSENDFSFQPHSVIRMQDESMKTMANANWNTELFQSIDVYVAIMDFKPMESDEEAVAMREGQQVEIIDASKPRRWLVRTLPMNADETPKEGWVPACYLEKSTAYDTLSSYVVTEAELDPKELEAIQNREAIVKELVETEEDFAKDMQYVVDNYYKQMDNPRLPKEFRDRKGSVFGNFKDICDFHNNVLMKGVHYHAKEATKLGKTFLRLERDFDMHASYCWNEARAQRLLKEGPLKEYFDDHSRMIDDDKLLSDHLKLPIQRLNDYQLLLKELIKYSSRLNEDTTDLQKALDFIHSINTRTKDLQLIQAIQGCQGDLLKIGRVIKHDTFDVIEGNEGRLDERYVFLFKGRVFVTEKQTVSGKEFYHVTNLFKLQDVEMIENVDTDPLKILFRSLKKNRAGFPLTFRARCLEQKATWTKELSAANQAVEDLGDLEPVLDRPQSFADIDGTEPEQKLKISLEPDLKKQKTETFKRQDSITKKSADSSAPQTPTEETTALPLTRQDSIKKESKSAESSVPSTPTDITSKPPRLSRQDSEKKKQKSAESSAPQTPTETSANEPSLARKDSIKKKSKSAEISEPSTPTEGKSVEPPLVRQDSVTKTYESAESSELRTPTETEAPLLTRQDSVKRKPKRISSITEKETEAVTLVLEESENTVLTRQESLSKKEKISVSEKRKSEIETAEDNSTKTKVRRQDSLKKEVKKDASETAEQSKEKTDFVSKPAKTTEEKQIKEIDAMDKPRFAKTLRGLTCVLGETAVLECETDGRPEPSVTWLKDNHKLAKSDRIITSSVGQKHSLTLKDVNSEDGGLYTVVASNSKGSASCSAPLNLKLPLLGVPKEDSRPTTPGGTILPHAPVFKVKLNKETQLLEGTSVRFELVVRGNPEPEVKFFKDGKELKLDDRIRVSYESKEVFELILDHVVAKDAGTYSCVATNTEGEDKTVGTLSVVKHKDVFKGLEDNLEEEREPTPRPKTPKFKWFKDGQYFEANERFQVIFNEEQDSLALMFQHVTPEDAGLYTCVASTSSGSKIACSAELTVQGVIRQVEAPSIKAELSDVEATEGGSAMLELKITGYPKPKVTWYHKNKEVSTGGRFRFLFADEETFTLVIKNVKKDDSGKYSVKASNEMGEAESSCNLTVKSAPSFIKGLKDMSVMAEEVIKFEVEVDGNPAPEIKWYKDGQQLNPNEKIKIKEEAGKLSLQIMNAKPADSGSYSCVLTNNLGSQAEFSNVVVKASPTFTKGMQNIEGLENDTLKFNVEINGNPKPTIKWSKDGKELSVDGKHVKVIEEGANAYSLVIEKSTAADVGIYTCELRNEHGLKASSGNLNIKMKPEFVKKLADIEALEGDSGFILNTTVKGYPSPTVKWTLNDEILVDGKDYGISSEMESHTLKMKRVNRNNSGKYVCEATNEMGSASTSGTLTVKVTKKKPEIDVGLKALQLVEGKLGKLVAKVSGEPKPKISWLKDGKPLTQNGRISIEEAEDGTISLIINNVTPEDAGVYSIMAVSDDGEATSEAPITTVPPGKKPEFIQELEKCELMEGQSLHLHAKVAGNPTSIKWQKDGEDISANDHIKITEESDGRIALMIDKVNQNDAGKYTVIASNAEGKARSAALVQVQAVKKPEIISSLEPLTLKDGETGQLKVKATGQPRPTIKWLKNGKELRPTNRVECIEEPDGTVALIIKNARPEDAGNYTFIAQNSQGEVKSSADVVIEQAPTFQKKLEPVKVIEGYPAKLEAKLSGSPPPEIKWLKDGEEIVPDSIHLKEIRSPDGTVALLIDNCKPEDIGNYSLTAKNPLGENSTSGTLTVSGKDSSDTPKFSPSFVSPIGNLSVKEGEPIQLEAKVCGNPLPDISWIVNNEALQPSDNILMTFDGEKAILEIKRSSPDHIGVYKCKLSNPEGEAISESSVSVQEKSAPHFIQRLNDFNSFVDQHLKLTCKVTGYPEPEVDWYFNGDVISPSNPKYNFSRLGDAYTLHIQCCEPSDTGIYECKARNSVGEDHTMSAVNISDKVQKGEPPMFLKKIGDNEVMEGMTAKFTACITGIPTPDVNWVREGKPLEPSPRHKMELESTGILRLIIRDVEASDYGTYSVTISNIHGSATSSAKLCPDSLDMKFITPIGDQFVDFEKFKKTGIPVPLPERPRIVRMDDTSLTLGWRPSVPNTPRVPVTYQLEMASYPDGEWIPYKTGLKDTLCDVRDLKPGQDYKFQIRVTNKHGISDPSPYTTAHRSKIYEPPKPSDFKPKDYEIEHPPLTKYAAPPRFLRKEEDIMYGVRGHPVTIEFWVYGYPEPQITWFKGESQIGKDKYSFLQDRNGKLCVFIDCMTDDFVGTYTCLAVNDEGEANMKIKLLIAESPVFIERLDETTAMSRRSARMQCRVTGVPYPKIKWFKDWHPLYESDRTKILWEEPDKCTLFISNLISRDNALYSCSATNIAGTATSSANLNVEDSEDIFDAKTYCRPIPVRPRTKIFEDFYDIGDELGRGTQGIVYHAVKRETGDSYAAKTMHGKGKLKEFMKAELDIMNQLCHPKLVRLRDAFETKDTLTLLTDICAGGELLGDILKRGGVTERDVANYIKQLLEGLDYMHSRYVGHLGLTVGDVLVSRMNSYDIRFGDFSLAARLLPGKDYYLEYGHPEFVAPEIANKQPASLLSDMWSVGVITYLLLSGISPFLGENDRETLTRVQQGKINFVEDAFTGVSDDAKDFMSKLLVFDPSGRMDVKSALQHRWLKFYPDKLEGSEKKLNNLERLKDYQRRWRDWYANASCKRYYRRRTLESCFHHPSRMIYPPGESYTPPSSPEPDLERTHVKPSQFDDVTFRQKINREDIDFRSESSYQNGPDTYLLQLRDTDFPLRLRQYLRVGASISPSLAANLRDQHWGDSTLVIRERRKFVDVMDEEIDDERKGLIPTTIPRRLYHEIGTLGFAREQMEQLKKEVWKDKGSREIEIGMTPFFREKIRNMAMKEGDEIVFRCYAIGTPKVDYSWFRNDGILLESSRIVVTELKDGRCELRINPTRAYDIGVYKCVARNMHGVSCCRARLKLGSKPGRPEAPVVKDSSDTEIYITWAVPRDEGNCITLGYSLEYKKSDEEEWITVSNNIEHEYFVVRNLSPSTYYQFRVKAYNKFGWGEAGIPTEPVSTKAEGTEKVKVSPRRKYQQEFTERTPDYELKESELPELDYNRETNPVPLVEGDPLDLYRIVSEMDRGRYSVVLNVWVKESNTSSIAKVIQKTDAIDGKDEYEILKSLCHERIVTLLSASYHADKTVLIMEKLSGVDVMTYLALRHDYNEELVITIIKQVLEAIQYLHFRSVCYIELQPDNVVMVNLRDSDIKLVDFGSARFVPKTGGKIHVQGTPEYLAPEVLKNEEISSLTDVWCVGVLTYILLSGVSPFLGKDEEETKENVTFVRYHFEHLHSNVTSEVTRFLLNIFKQCPIKRLTIDECLEHKWLAPSEYMIMKRESARFLPDKLAAFAKKFHAEKYEAMNPELLTSLGMSSSKSELKVDDF